MTLQFITPFSVRIGVAGAGTMGSGIALTALLADMPVTLYDVSADMLANARSYVESHLERKGKAANIAYLDLTSRLDDMESAGVLIEAVPEDLALKQELFATLDGICALPAILATNTSTLPVTAIAAAAKQPQRVAGMHFFNPAPVMPLVEVIQGAQTHPNTIQSLVSLAIKLGKTPVVARDTPGFIVNRVARPFYGEALRILGEGVATHEKIDQIVRLGGGFRMGPFELMDLIGIDINLAAMQSMYQQTHWEPRYKPHLIQDQMVQQKAMGRKTGRGFYDYSEGQKTEDLKAAPPDLKGGRAILLPGSMAPELAALLRKAGFTLSRGMNAAADETTIGIAAASPAEGLRRQVAELDRLLPPGIPLICQCADITLTEVATWMEHPDRLVGIDGLFLAGGSVATLVPGPTLTPGMRSAADRFISNLGFYPIWINDAPGLVLPRIVCMLANEAIFAVQERVAEAEKVDLAMKLGVNYPTGPIAWAKQLGYANVLSVLDHLYSEFHEERYRAAPLLRRWERVERVSA